MSRASVLPRNPAHGVSGYNTTGAPGDFQFQFHDRVPLGIRDAASSRFGVQAHGSERESDADLYKPFYTDPTRVREEIPAPNTSAFFMEPANSAAAERAYLVASRELSRILQRKMKAQHGTYLKNRMYEGFGQFDPAIQRMIPDYNIDEVISHSFTPASAKHNPPSIIPPIRHGEFALPTQNVMPQPIIVQLGQPDGNVQQLEQINRPLHTTGAVVAPGTGMQAGGAASSSGVTNKAGSLPMSNVPYASLYPSPQPNIQPTGSSATPQQKVARFGYIQPGHTIQQIKL